MKALISRQYEKKFFNIAPVLNSTATSANISTRSFATTNCRFSLLNDIRQGTDANSRTGNKIMVKSIQVSIRITPFAFKTGNMILSGSLCRCVLLRNKETNGSIFTPSDVFDGGFGFRNNTKLPQFEILGDKIHSMVATTQGPTVVTSTAGPMTVVSFNIFPNKKIDYVSNTGSPTGTVIGGVTIGPGMGTTATNLLKDDYQLGIWADNDDCCQVEVIWKVNFTDN